MPWHAASACESVLTLVLPLPNPWLPRCSGGQGELRRAQPPCVCLAHAHPLAGTSKRGGGGGQGGLGRAG